MPVNSNTLFQTIFGIPHIGIIFIVLSCLFYSMNTVLAKVVTTPAVQIGLYRACLQYLILLPILISCGVQGVKDIIGPRSSRPYLFSSGLSNALSSLFLYLSIKNLSPGNVMSLSFLDIVMVPIIGRVIFKTTFTLLDGIFSLVAFGGVVLIAQPPFLFPNAIKTTENDIGVLYGFLSALCATFGHISLYKVGRSVSPIITTFYFTMGALLVFTTGALATGDFEYICLHQLGLTVLLSCFGFLGICAYNASLQTERPSTIAIFMTSQIIFVYVVQIIFLEDIPTTISLIGSGLIVSTSLGIGIRKAVNEKRKSSQTKDGSRPNSVTSWQSEKNTTE